MDLNDFLASKEADDESMHDLHGGLTLIGTGIPPELLKNLRDAIDTHAPHPEPVMNALYERLHQSEYGRASDAIDHDNEEPLLARTLIEMVRMGREKLMVMTDTALTQMQQLMAKVKPDSAESRFYAPIAQEIMMVRDGIAQLDSSCDNFAKFQACLSVNLFRLENFPESEVTDSWVDPGVILQETLSSPTANPSSSAPDVAL